MDVVISLRAGSIWKNENKNHDYCRIDGVVFTSHSTQSRQDRTVLIMFPLIHKTITVAQMMFIGEEGGDYWQEFRLMPCN